MAGNADRIAHHAISSTFSDTHTVISVSQRVTLRIVCVCATDTPPAQPRRDLQHLVAQRRLTLPVAAASLALAAVPLLRRLPIRSLAPGAVIRERTLLAGATERAAQIRHSPQPRRLDAGRPMLAAGRDDTSRRDGMVRPATVSEVVDAQPRSEREPELVAGVPS